VDAEVRDAYLRRLGLDAEPPSVEALVRLHRAQVERVPYETLWIHTGDRWGIGPAESAARIAAGTRGGYCFQLNGAFSALLRALGYQAQRHVGGVHGPTRVPEQEMANHLVLTVEGLATETCPDGVWYVDTGLGDALHEPVPLAPGPIDQGPFSMRLEAEDEVGDWHLTHDPAGAFAGMAWLQAPTGMDAFAAKHQWLSTAPESGFVRVLTVQRREATGVDVLRGCVLQRIGEGQYQRDLASRADLDAALGDIFHIDLAELDAVAVTTMWDRMQREHERWDAAGRP
jgi:arylamine N-acetyltransferase